MKLKLYEVTNSVNCEDHFNLVLAYNKTHACELVEKEGTFYDFNFVAKKIKPNKKAGVISKFCSTSYTAG